MADEIFTPKHLKFWTMPENYFGAVHPATYVGLSRHRDSDDLTESNFFTFLKRLGGESETVEIIRESHWAVGWVEWIAIHQDDEQAVKLADEMLGDLESYPVLDDDDFSAREQESANHIWRECYDWRARVDYIRRHRSQFEFHDKAEIRAVVKGEYFTGYASELIY